MGPRRIGWDVSGCLLRLARTLGLALAATLFLAVLPKVGVARPHLVINEIDYAQPGAPDSLEWIELWNSWDAEMFLGNVFLVFYHVGPDGQCHEYLRVDLSPLEQIAENSYEVFSVNPCAIPYPLSSATKDVVGNGPRDAIALQWGTGQVIDSVEYAAQSSQSSCHLVATPVEDSETGPGSIQRCGNHWIFSSISTPCGPNNCTVSDVPSMSTPWGAVKSLYR